MKKTPHAVTERRIVVAVTVLASLAIVGTIGFVILGHGHRTVFDAFWMTIQILTTVGDTGMQRTHGDQVWSVGLMVVGVMAVFYLGISVVRFILDGELRELLGRRQLESKRKKLEKHFIVCGFGRMGRSLAEAIEKRGASLIVIDSNEKRIEEADNLGHLHIHGDAMLEDVLNEAQIDRAAGLAACLGDDADNVFVALTARDLNSDINIVAKANFEESQAKLRRAGANHVLSPNKLAADRAMTKFMLPGVDELIEFVVHGADLEVSKLSLDRFPDAVGKTLRDLELPSRTGLIVVAMVHNDGGRTFNPSPTSVLAHGDELIVIGTEGGVGKMVELFGPEEVAN